MNTDTLRSTEIEAPSSLDLLLCEANHPTLRMPPVKQELLEWSEQVMFWARKLDTDTSRFLELL